VGARQSVSGEGHPVAQWEIGLRDLAAFVERRRGSQVPA
jgi:hypothetical protein